MKNKVLVHVLVPELDADFDLFIPVNELIWKIEKLLLKSVSDLCTIPIESDARYVLMNKDSNRIYSNNEQVINTDIRNGTELLLFSQARTIGFGEM